MAGSGVGLGGGVRGQAAAAADAAVPSVGSIFHQYGQSMSDASGFTQALMHILSQQPGIGAAYNQAIGQQQGVDTAAAQRIAAVTGGMPTAASSGAVVGGLADSALSHLIANQGAARAYGATLPVAAAARGALENQSLITARNQALQQRAQARTQAFNSALGQAQQNALALREFGINTQLKQQSMALQAQNEQAINAEKYAALAQNRSQFNARQTQQWQEFQTKLQASVKSGTAPGLRGYTPSEINTYERLGGTYAQSAGMHGLTIQQAISNMVAQNIPRSVAVVQAQLQYAQLAMPTKNEFTSHAGTANASFDSVGYARAMKGYGVALNSFKQWVNLRQFMRSLPKGSFVRSKPPGHPE